jgi:ATP-dependent helicase HrpA
MIGHTQPRRVAARSIASRLAEELNTTVGQHVGFKVRFTDTVSDSTYIKLMTDGILLAEIQHDRYLNAYDTLIIDEAHERSLNIDFVLGHLRQLLPRRTDLKVIVTSATIDPERFSRHFGGAPILNVEGRTYPVELRYRPLMSADTDDRSFELTDAIVSALDELLTERRGDTLVFLPGERDIRELSHRLRTRTDDVDVLPLYSRLSAEEQMRVFKPHTRTRIILATNVAETSLTVPGIRFVIDPGLARINRYSARSRVQRLPIEPISRASADQRKGRCGRTSDGVCIRLYSQDDFESRPQFTDPEILRTNLASVILQLKANRLGNVEDFPFIDSPDYRQIRDGYQTLHELGAIDEANQLTALGRILAKLPIDPRIGRMIVAANDENCLDDVIIIAAALSIQDPRERPVEKQASADEAHSRFRVGGSDFRSLLNLWHFYHDSLRTLSSSQLRKACKANFLSYVRLREWHDIVNQLREITSQEGWRCHAHKASPDAIHRALLTGLLSNIGQKSDAHEYTGIRGRKFHLFPGSVLFHKKPAWIMCGEIVETTRLFARTCAEIDPTWIEKLAPHLLKHSYSDPHWQQTTGRVVAYEKVVLQGLAIVARRTVHYGPIDPVTSRQIFIQSALVDGDLQTNAHYFRHNQALVREIELLESQRRKRDLLVDSRARFAFYDSRIPAGVYSQQLFDRWRRDAEVKQKRVLFMDKQDLLLSSDVPTPEQFPTALVVGDVRCPLDYHFAPNDPLDGVTVTVRLAQLNRLREERLQWLVPGLIEEKVQELIRSLPKPIRVQLVPVPDFARRALSQMTFGHGALHDELAGILGKFVGAKIAASAFDLNVLPEHLKLNVRVHDDDGRAIAMGRDLAAIRHELKDRLRENFAQLPSKQFVRDGIRKWDFGDLPDRVEMRVNGTTVEGYPAIVDCGDSVSLRLLESKEASTESSRAGVRRLFVLEFQNSLEYQVSSTREVERLSLYYSPLGNAARLRAEIASAIADRLVFGSLDVRTKAEFERRLDEAWNRQPDVALPLIRTTSQILDRFHELQLAVGKLSAPLLQESRSDIQRQLGRLVPPDFLTRTPRSWLDHLPRFLDALLIRIRKLSNAGLSRDRSCMQQIAELEELLRERKEAFAADEVATDKLNELDWVLEELRVSLFAQELKTSIPVSPQRFHRLLEEFPLRR